MTVYVDDMWRFPMGQLGRMKMSHMIGDTDEELHAFAQQLGLKREWFQHGDHYDVSKGVRGRAIELGARAITVRQLSAMAMLRRYGAPMGKPEDAEKRLKEFKHASTDNE
jgi:uncharacterized protein DUF4031